MRLAALALLAILAGTVSAQAEQAGVLCQWGIEMSVQATGEHCFAGQDAAFQAAVRDSVARIDAFIVANEPTTADKLAAPDKMSAQAGYCSATAVAFYQRLKAASPEQIRSGTAALLATARKPTVEPCL